MPRLLCAFVAHRNKVSFSESYDKRVVFSCYCSYTVGCPVPNHFYFKAYSKSCSEQIWFQFYFYKSLSFPKIINLNLYHLDSAMCHALALKMLVPCHFPGNSKKLPTVVQSH